MNTSDILSQLGISFILSHEPESVGPHGHQLIHVHGLRALSVCSPQVSDDKQVLSALPPTKGLGYTALLTTFSLSVQQ